MLFFSLANKFFPRTSPSEVVCFSNEGSLGDKHPNPFNKSQWNFRIQPGMHIKCFSFQGDNSNAQSQPTGAVAAVPYYTQPAAVSIVPRPQVVLPVTGQPPFHAGARPTIAPSGPVPTQVHWQPSQVQYQEVRPATFQPMVHYGAVPQASPGSPGQAVYGVATGAGVHYVRGMKDPPQGHGRSSPSKLDL